MALLSLAYGSRFQSRSFVLWTETSKPGEVVGATCLERVVTRLVKYIA